MRVFISRAQTPDSPFYQAVSPQATVVGQSLVAIDPVLPSTLPPADWLFFFSQNGLRHGLPHWLGQGSLPAIGVMGSGSAAFLTDHFELTADFVGRGTVPEVAQAFGAVATGRRVVFVQAARSRRAVQIALGDRIRAAEVVVYQNRPAPNDHLPFCEVLVFTSPMNVAAYFTNHQPHPEQQIISIGQTTGAALKAQGLQ